MKLFSMTSSMFLAMACSAAICSDIRQDESNDDATIVGFATLLDENGEDIGGLLSVRLPVPDGLAWNTPKEFWADMSRGAPRKDIWVYSNTLMQINGKTLNSVWPKRLVWEGDFATAINSPFKHYIHSFKIPPDTKISDVTIQFFDPLARTNEGKENKIGNRRVLAKLQIDETSLKKLTLEPKAEVKSLSSLPDCPDRFYIELSINLIKNNVEFLQPKFIRQIRIGSQTSDADMRYVEISAFGNRLSKDVVGFEFSERPKAGLDIQLKIDGIDEWISCRASWPNKYSSPCVVVLSRCDRYCNGKGFEP